MEGVPETQTLNSKNLYTQISKVVLTLKKTSIKEVFEIDLGGRRVDEVFRIYLRVI